MNPDSPLRTAKRLTGLTCLVAILGLAALAGGCTTVVDTSNSGASITYQAGKLETFVAADLAKTTVATRRALEILRFASVRERTDALNSVFVARTALDKKVEVTLTKVSDATTRIDIRVGLIGDQDVSLAVLEKIRTNL